MLLNWEQALDAPRYKLLGRGRLNLREACKVTVLDKVVFHSCRAGR
jgi:hypothetical protein